MKNILISLLTASLVTLYIIVVLFFTDLILKRHIFLTLPAALTYLFWKESRPISGMLLILMVAVPLILIGFGLIATFIAAKMAQ